MPHSCTQRIQEPLFEASLPTRCKLDPEVKGAPCRVVLGQVYPDNPNLTSRLSTRVFTEEYREHAEI